MVNHGCVESHLIGLPKQPRRWLKKLTSGFLLPMNRIAAFRRQELGRPCWRASYHAKSDSSRFCRINAAIQVRAGSWPVSRSERNKELSMDLGARVPPSGGLGVA
jgi:hypothetical protein